MRRTLLAIIMSALAAGGMTLAQHGGHGKDGVQVKLLSQKDIIEKLDGKKAKATLLEVTRAPGEVEAAHRHPGPAFGYVLEGEYEWAVDDNKPKVLQELKKKFAITIVTHNLQQAKRVADKTAFLYVDTTQGGRTGYLVEMGDTKQVFENPREKHTQDYIRGEFS